jgi:PAB-dependent poly(A)-specific ribonuclease subunit 2
MKVVDGIGRAPNPGKRRRNEIPYEMTPLEDKSDKETGLEEVPCLSTEINSDLTGIPKRYHRVDMMGIEGIDFSQGKPSIFAGLQRHNNPNTYCNALLQVLYFIEPLHCVMESHVCPRESCLSCELGFLFSALDLTLHKSCETTSLIQVFQNLPEATALGLVLSEKDAGKANLARLSQSWSRFILQQISKDIETNDQPSQTEETTPGSTELSVIEKIFSMEIDTETRCRCGKKSNRLLKTMQLSLNYPRGRNGDLLQLNDEVSFVHLLESSMQKEQTTQAWCDQCSKYKTHAQTREVRQLPDVMLISCLDDVRDYEFWKSQQMLLDSRKSTSANWLPVSITAILTSNGELTIQETETAEYDSSQNSTNTAVVSYDLMGIVSYVEAQMIPGHLVAHILPNDKHYKRKQVEAVKQWWLFNDQIVCEAEQDELLHFSNWRVPCHLCYTRRDLNDQYNLTVQPVTDSRLLHTPPINKATARPAASTFKPVQPDEILTDKAVVAVGAEFVALLLEQSERTIGKVPRRCPARITVIRGDGPLEGIPLIDDYIAQSEQSIEFLAQYCGVKHGDLEPAISNKHLVSLKTACLKLRYLRDTGIKFVGYGLAHDLHPFNFYASEECLLDIAQLFHLPGERSVPLRFMAWYFLGMHVQTSGRNSIEDAQTALKLYRKYNKLKDDPSVDFVAAVQRLYRAARQHDWNVPA